MCISINAQVTPSSYNSNWSYGSHHKLLVANEIWEGDVEQIMTYQSSIIVTIYSDESSATDGLEVRQGHHPGLWQSINKFTYSGGTKKNNSFVIPIYYNYVQISYINGSVAQDTMELTTSYYKYAQIPTDGEGFIKNKTKLELKIIDGNESPSNFIFDYSKLDTLIKQLNINSNFVFDYSKFDTLSNLLKQLILKQPVEDVGVTVGWRDSTGTKIDTFFVNANNWIRGDIYADEEIEISHNNTNWQILPKGKLIPILLWNANDSHYCYIKKHLLTTVYDLRLNYK